MPVTIYHNPRCSKSRQTLALLQEQGVEPKIVHYLDEPPTAAQLKKIIQQLGIRPADLLRRGEAVYKQLKLTDHLDDDAAIIAAMVDHPILIERPIVITSRGARLGRPPQSVLEIL